EEGVERPELERAVRALLATQRDRLLHDEHPLLERLPAGVVAALEHAIADYLPLAVERIGGLLSDPEARARIRDGLKRFLDRAIRNLAMHERVMAKLVITESRIERVLPCGRSSSGRLAARPICSLPTPSDGCASPSPSHCGSGCSVRSRWSSPSSQSRRWSSRR